MALAYSGRYAKRVCVLAFVRHQARSILWAKKGFTFLQGNRFQLALRDVSLGPGAGDLHSAVRHAAQDLRAGFGILGSNRTST